MARKEFENSEVYAFIDDDSPHVVMLCQCSEQMVLTINEAHELGVWLASVTSQETP